MDQNKREEMRRDEMRPEQNRRDQWGKERIASIRGISAIQQKKINLRRMEFKTIKQKKKMKKEEEGSEWKWN